MLSDLLSLILAKTPLNIAAREDLEVESPDNLMAFPIHHKVGDLVAESCLSEGLSERGAYAFGEFVAELLTGWSTRYSNEPDVMLLDNVFGQAAYGSPTRVIRLYLLPDWSALSEHIEDIQRGLAAAFEVAKSLGA